MPTETMEGTLTHRIRQLPAIVANQIAAGEVVERPASIVKELLENALDAGPSRIALELEAGGIELVRVTDDGCGIPAIDLPMALAPHATSKIERVEDLDRIGTLGFRGEALASIASVARVSLRSRTKDQPAASLVRVEGGVWPSGENVVEPASAGPGTCVSVRNVFYNTPARRKFLRTIQTERDRCVDAFEHIAMAHPGVGFALTIDGKLTHDLRATETPRERVLAIIGKELSEQVIEVSADRFDDARGLSLWGLAGLPSIARGSIKGQHVFVNGRPVRDRTIQHAIAEAYRGLIEPGRYPTVVLMLAMSPEGVDVNVHPQKTEVRFRDSSMVHGVVLRALRDALATKDLTPRASDLRPHVWGSQALGGVWGRSAPSASAGNASFSWEEPKPINATDGDERFAAFFRRASVSSPALEAPQAQTTSAEPSRDTLLQVHNSYVITQDEQGVVIIDQHALHERAMFEYLARRVLAGNLESQQLLMPVVVPTTSDLVARAQASRELFSRIGLEVAQVGPSSLGVSAFPTFLFERGVDPLEFVDELLTKIEKGEVAGSGSAEHALRDVLDMMACKAAIKAGDHLAPQELQELIALRDQVERSSNCPHGRPTSIRLTLAELARLFGRA